MKVGTPPVELKFIIETGARFHWTFPIHSKLCKKNPIYDEENSKTF